MFQNAPPPKPFIVTIVPDPSHTTTIFDVVVASIGLAGALFAGAVLLGIVIAVIMIVWRRRHSPISTDVPSVTSMTPLQRPSSPTR